MAMADREIHVIYDPAISTDLLIVEIDTTPAGLPIATGRAAHLAAFVLVPLSTALIALLWAL